MVEGQVFLKRTGRGGGGRGEGWHFSYLNFSLQNCVMHLKQNYFFCHHNFMKKKKIILSCLKIDLKIFHQLRKPDLFAKGFKKLKIDF